jgi:hypothetical protein
MMTSDTKRALAKTIRELREKIILPDLRRPAGRGGLPRAPRGAAEGLDASWDSRRSFCCAVEGCRRRSTPPSVRFLGRKVYVGAIVVLATVAGGAALAGLRANEARYFKNKYGQAFVVKPASKAKKLIDYVHRILKQERDIVIESRPLEATELHVENIRWTFVFYESGLAINVLYTLDDKKKRAVGFKLSDGMEVPPELASRFKFAIIRR